MPIKIKKFLVRYVDECLESPAFERLRGEDLVQSQLGLQSEFLSQKLAYFFYSDVFFFKSALTAINRVRFWNIESLTFFNF